MNRIGIVYVGGLGLVALACAAVALYERARDAGYDEGWDDGRDAERRCERLPAPAPGGAA